MRRDLLMTLATRLLLVGISAVTAILTARLLGPAERGEFFLAITISGLGVQLLCLGLPSSNTYLVAEDRRVFHALHANSVWITGVSCAVITVTGAGMAMLDLFPLSGWSLTLALLAIPPALYYLFGANLLLGVGETARFNRFELLSRIAPLSLIFPVWFWPHATVLLLSYLLASVAVAILLFRMNRTAASVFAWPDKDLLKRSLHYGARAYVVMLLGFLVARTPVLILGWYDNPYEVGQLSVALQVTDMLVLAPATVAMLLFPRLVQDSAGREEAFAKWLRRVAFVMLPGCLIVAALCDPVIPLLFGEPFRSSVTVLYALLPGVFFLALISIMSQYLGSIGMPWSLTIPWIIGLCTSVGLAWFLMPRFGAQGVAIALSIAYAVIFVTIAALCFQRYQRLRQAIP